MSTEKSTARGTHKRKGVRFKPDPGAYAEIEWGAARGDFKGDLIGLVTDESFRGCGLVIVFQEPIRTGSKLRVRIGNGPVLRAEVKWSSFLDSEVVRVGVTYLE